MVNIRIKTDKNNKGIIFGIWILVCIVAKVIQITILPAKYSADGRRIFTEAATGYRTGDSSYDFAANFFSVANKIFHIGSYEGWSIFLGVVGSGILLWFIRKSLEKLYFWDFIFLSSSLFLMNVYVFNISKEIIQILILIPAVFVLHSSYKANTKIVIIVIFFLIVAVFLRRYFFLTALIFFMVCKIFLRSLDQGKAHIWRNIVFILIVGILGMYFLESFAPNVYEEIFQARYNINDDRIGDADAQTIINDVLEDDGTIKNYLLNLLINLFRLLFPFELVTKGILQILFLIYQIILSIKLMRLLFVQLKESINENILIAASLLIAYLIVAAIFEPDYGSVIRHEMAVFPIMYAALIRRVDDVEKK